MREIKLTQSKVAFVDDEDYKKINKSNWHASLCGNTYYAIRRTLRHEKKDSVRVYMHYLILPSLPGFEVDHRDGNGLNNQRYNLRYCTHQQNQRNQKPQSGTSSKYKGVSWATRDRIWRVFIKINKKSRFLGNFNSEKEAALAYNCAALQYFGEFARPNITDSSINREELLEKLIKMEGEEDGKATTTK